MKVHTGRPRDTGADPEIEEGGGHTYKVEIGAARVGHSCPCAR